MFGFRNFGKTNTSNGIEKLCSALEEADAVIIGAGAGLSTSAGFVYTGERFEKHFHDFAEKYHFSDMYSGGFYPFDTLEEYWVYWSRYIWINRYTPAPKPVYEDLLGLVKNKDYFVLTTNVDHQFQKAGFDKHRLFYTQGDYGLFQCNKPCCQKTYDNEATIRQMVEQQKGMRVPTELVPHCPLCGKPMTMNLRCDDTFVQDEGWYSASERYGDDWEAIHQAAQAWYKSFPASSPIYANKHYSWMDNRGVYFASDISGPHFGQYRYNVLHPVTRKVVKEPASGWRYPEYTMLERIREGLVHFGKDETTVPCNKTYLADTVNQSVGSVKYKDGRAASKQLAALMGCNCFTNPKDVDVLQSIFKSIGLRENDIIMDFFSGSASSAEAVMRMGNELNIPLSFIMVQLPEDLDISLANAVGSAKQVMSNAIELCDTLGVPHSLAEIGKERIRRAGDKIKSESPMTMQDLDIGFRVLKLDDTNMKDVYYAPDDYDQGMLAGLESNIKDDRTDLDLLFGCLIDWGLPLSLPYKSEQIDGCTVHTYNDGDLIACFDTNIPESVVKEIAQRKPLRAVFRDSGFASSPEKINVFEIFKLYMPEDAGDITKRVRVI